jgi:hypothetical protein
LKGKKFKKLNSIKIFIYPNLKEYDILINKKKILKLNKNNLFLKNFKNKLFF